MAAESRGWGEKASVAEEKGAAAASGAEVAYRRVRAVASACTDRREVVGCTSQCSWEGCVRQEPAEKLRCTTAPPSGSGRQSNLIGEAAKGL